MRLIFRSTIFVASIAVILISIEVLLRIVYRKQYMTAPWQTSIKFKADERLIYTLNPNTRSEWKTDEFYEIAQTNNQGYRYPHEIMIPKNPDNYRVFAVGDSFTFGHGLKDEETYPSILESLLNENAAKIRNIEVVNAGVPGYAPDQEYRVIIERILLYNPDMIIWNLASGDVFDITETIPDIYYHNDNKLVSIDGRTNWLYIQNWLFVHVPYFVRTLHTFDYLVGLLPKIAFLKQKPQGSTREVSTLALKKLYIQFKTLKELEANHGFKLIIVRLPTKEDFYSGQHTQLVESFFSEMNSFLNKNKIRYIDVRQLIAEFFLKKTLKIENLFFEEDVHLNADGTRLVASLIFERL